LEKDLSLILVRNVEPAWSFLVRSDTLLLLAVFWTFSVALAWMVARGFVQPLRLLAARLPQIENDLEAALPGADRNDEIGQLVRAYHTTRSQLAAERGRREQAERLAILGRMATGLAHEIYNPLAAIRMHAQLIESAHNGELASTARESLPVLLGETSKIEGMVQQWMFLARPQPPKVSTVDLGEIVAGVIRALTPQAAHAGVQIVDGVPQNLRARVDSRRLSQAIGNILLNGFQAMSSGGTITILGERVGNRVDLSFRDTGRGFSPDALAHYADLFFSTKEGGMGIGLSVTTEILKAHDGVVTVANAPEGGAIVTLQIPFRL
jgi:signal transduction histidine kinase